MQEQELLRTRPTYWCAEKTSQFISRYFTQFATDLLLQFVILHTLKTKFNPQILLVGYL